MVAMDDLRKEIDAQHGEDFNSLNIWKEKITLLQEYSKGYMEDDGLMKSQAKRLN
jgi:hypothetical protein